MPHSSSEDHTEENNSDSRDIPSSGKQQTSENYSIAYDRP